MKELIKEEKSIHTMFTPHMEYYFDEITEQKSCRCPVSGKMVTVEVVKRAHTRPTPFVDVVYCSAFKGCPLCEKTCLALVNTEETQAERRLY